MALLLPRAAVSGPRFSSVGDAADATAPTEREKWLLPNSGGSADAFRREFDDLGRLVLGDQVGTGRNIAARDETIFRVVGQEHDWQVALQELLLVDSERRLARGDRLEESCREVESPDIDLSGLAGVLDRRERRLARCSGAERKDRVDVGIRRQRRLDFRPHL